MKFILISKDIAVKMQGVHLIEHLKDANGTKLRVDIYSDAYPAQCHARIDRWDGTQWQSLAYRPAPIGCCKGGIKTKAGLSYLPNAMTRDFTKDFDEDREWLLDVAGVFCCDKVVLSRRDTTGKNSNPKRRYYKALTLVRTGMKTEAELESTRNLRQAAADVGIPYGDEMEKFIAWANVRLVNTQ